MEKYDPVRIESKWQEFWRKIELFKSEISKDKKKCYVLSMFPYPSGVLHMGHVMNYTIGDVIVRYSIMNGMSVFSPIGWDSFGLPAENAAIREGIHPSKNIRLNIDRMKEQMIGAGWGFDWRRELATSEEDYYRWTQWLFLKFFKAGLVKRKHAPVNWCPSCKTVLANEQVHDGSCERCNTPVEQKDLNQWFFLMSRYAERLLDNHKKLTKWPERVLKMQKAWIGRSEGTLVNFKLEGSDKIIDVFTTRPDTLFGVTFMSIAPQHPLIEELIKDHPEKENLLKTIKRMRMQGTSEEELLTREKEGIFTGKYAVNPVNGQKIPIWIANFVLMNYGTGIIMAVPGHDQRDFEFARKYNISIKVVIQPEGHKLSSEEMECAYVDDGEMVDSGEFSGRNNREAMSDIIEWLDKNGFGKKTVTYRLRDWLLSRQRYWGVPIPIVYCGKCGIVPIPEDQLPVKLPGNVEFRPTGESPLESSEEFINTICPECGGKARRESDTMDTFVDSSWYYLRYTSPKFTDGPFNKEHVKYWCPVDIYIGGIEHATMHLIYFRFFAMVLHDFGLIEFEEPVEKLFCQGMVCKTAYYCERDKWLPEDKVNNGKCSICGNSVSEEVVKMSKTKLNVVSPEEIIEKFGADTMRMYILSDNPPDRDQVWNEDGVLGANRFLKRLWDTSIEIIERMSDPSKSENKEAASDKKVRMAAHQTLMRCRQVFEETWQFNTAMARVMELLNILRKEIDSVSNSVLRESMEILLKMVAPVSPHITEELWRRLGYDKSIFRSSIPEIDESALVQDAVTIVVQINGKLRGKFTAEKNASKEYLEKNALDVDRVKKHIIGKTIRKVIVVPDKLVNIVAN